MTNESDIASKVVQVLSSVPDQKLIGTKLATILGSTCGYSSAVHGKLRDFVDANVPGVVRVGQAGKDWIYQLKSSVTPTSGTGEGAADAPAQPVPSSGRSPMLDTAVWKAFASPNTQFKLFVNHETGEVRVLPPGSSSPDGPWKHLPPCPIEKHLEIANAWVQTLPDPNTRVFLETALKTGSGPASMFYETVRKLALTPQWNRFRTQRIMAVFDAAIHELGVDRQQIVSSAANPAIQPAMHRVRDAVSTASSTHGGPRHLREIAAAALERMSDAEIRNLAIPLGYVLDILEIR